MHLSLFKKLLVTIIIIVPFLLFLFLRLDMLSTDMTNSDAPRWHMRSERFLSALKSTNFAETYQSYHPGITLMWLTSGIEGVLRISYFLKDQEFKTLENTDGYELIDGTSKLVLVLVLFILLLIQYRYINILYDRGVALLFVLFIAIEPYFIGINRWYHLTSLETFLGFCALLAFILWVEYDLPKYMTSAGIFFGLTILTKFSGLFLIPVFALIFILKFITKKQLLRVHYTQSATIFITSSLITFVMLFPALWVSPISVFSNMFSAAQNAGAGEYVSVFFAERLPYLFYPAVLFYKFSPLTLILLAISTFQILRISKNTVTRMLLIHILIIFVLLSFSEQKIERYILALTPSILLVNAFVLARFKRGVVMPFLLACLLFTAYIYIQSHPIYSSYYSEAAGGPTKAYEIGLYDDNGEYYANAARYLNTKGRDIFTYVPNNSQSFSYYYKGNMHSTLEPNTNYYVESKDSSRIETQVPEQCASVEKKFYNQNLDVVTIYKCQ